MQEFEVGDVVEYSPLHNHGVIIHVKVLLLVLGADNLTFSGEILYSKGHPMKKGEVNTNWSKKLFKIKERADNSSSIILLQINRALKKLENEKETTRSC